MPSALLRSSRSKHPPKMVLLPPYFTAGMVLLTPDIPPNVTMVFSQSSILVLETQKRP